MYDVLVAMVKDGKLEVDLEPTVPLNWATKKTRLEKKQSKVKGVGGIPQVSKDVVIFADQLKMF